MYSQLLLISFFYSMQLFAQSFNEIKLALSTKVGAGKCLAISGDGNIIGGKTQVTSKSTTRRIPQATYWTNVLNFHLIPFDPLDPKDHFYSEISGLSENGSVMVGQEKNKFSTFAFAVFSGTKMRLGNLHSSLNSAATDVSDNGNVIVGWSQYGVPALGIQAYRYESSTLTPIGFPPFSNRKNSAATAVSGDGNIVVGWSSTNIVGQVRGKKAFIWEGGAFNEIPRLAGNNSNIASDISNDGSVTVGHNFNMSINSSGESQKGRSTAFRWIKPSASAENISTGSGSIWSEAYSASQNGDRVVGAAVWPGIGFSEAFIWDSSNNMRKIKEILTSAGASLNNWHLNSATAISKDGTKIIGWGRNPNQELVCWYATIP